MEPDHVQYLSDTNLLFVHVFACILTRKVIKFDIAHVPKVMRKFFLIWQKYEEEKKNPIKLSCAPEREDVKPRLVFHLDSTSPSPLLFLFPYYPAAQRGREMI